MKFSVKTTADNQQTQLPLTQPHIQGEGTGRVFLSGVAVLTLSSAVVVLGGNTSKERWGLPVFSMSVSFIFTNLRSVGMDKSL